MDWLKTEIWPAVQPMLRETANDEYPYAISGGTIFLAVYKGRAFAITARHVILPLTPICLFATDWSQKILPLENVFYVSTDKIDDDFADFAVIELDMRKLIKGPEFSLLKLIDLEKVSGDWLSYSEKATFLVLGYPIEHSEMDITEESITTARFTLKGNYKGVSEHSSSVHTISISNYDGVTDFNGLSGGPVFSIVPTEGKPDKIFFCGIVV